MNKPTINRWLINSLLDIDLYKITMLQAFCHAPEFRGVTVEWKFACRNPDVVNFTNMIGDIHHQLEHLSTLTFTNAELEYLDSFSFISRDFIEFLRIFRLDMRFVEIKQLGEGLDIRFRGPLIHVTLFEIYTLAIISELYTELEHGGVNLAHARRNLAEKISLVATPELSTGFHFADFGTRRRASQAWHEEVVSTLKLELPQVFAGTSNLDLARRYQLTPVGTMAHEWFQAWQAVTRLADAQKNALEGWVREYRGRLGIALTDCYSMDAFIRDFSDPYFAKLYDGLRHDSGPPIAWGEKAIAMYNNMGIDPRSKTLVFSDGLTFGKMIELYRYFNQRIKVSFGIGTMLTNDVGQQPLNIVIKMVAANGKPVAKISDEPAKSMCEDDEYLKYLASVYDIDHYLQPSSNKS
ncbi:MAG: nicotinate phosphoribosyltransferase [Desulfobacteraceae bacterium 4572_35.2]|nr:MAG: nicotinate phosphoribosyltransferase [Desulfobacteraceae bacterium 4572_35.2]